MYRRRRGRRAWPVVVSQSDVGVKSTNAYGDAHGAEAAAERQGGGCALRTVNVVATAAYMS